jgi:hypothetical protein
MKPDDDFETLFQSLEPVEARPEFMRRLREIPLQEAAVSSSRLSLRFWDFRLALGLAASLLGGVWFSGTELGQRGLGEAQTDDVLAFISMGSEDTLAEPFDVGLLE